MCKIKEGDEVYLIKGGKVLFPDGSIYNLKDCQLSGGRLIMGIEEGIEERSGSKKSIKWDKKKKVGGKEFVFEGKGIDLGEYSLETSVTTEIVSIEDKKEVNEMNEYVSFLPLTIIGAGLLYALKKVSGLDRELRKGTCEMRHTEAIVRIAKLEGKVLRRQIIDGGKKIKEKIDEKKENNE